MQLTTSPSIPTKMAVMARLTRRRNDLISFILISWPQSSENSIVKAEYSQVTQDLSEAREGDRAETGYHAAE